MSSRLERALAAIDAVNALDPEVVVIRGRPVAKELGHAELVTEWVQRLHPGADEAQLLAARASHLRRWAVPRSSYPAGRAGYLRWRADAKRRHAAEVAEILVAAGYEPAEVERVQAIVRKEGLGHDPAVQVHEDALCLVFLETQLDEMVQAAGTEKMLDVLVRTVAKMSTQGREAARSLAVGGSGADLLGRALSEH